MDIPIKVNDLYCGALKEFHVIQSYRRKLEFHRIYQKNDSLHPYLREAFCLEFQVPAMLQPIQDGDWFAKARPPGRRRSPERGDGVEAGFYIQAGQFRSQLAALPADDPRRVDIQSLLDFWGKRQTSLACRVIFSPQAQKGIPSDNYCSDAELLHPLYGLDGPAWILRSSFAWGSAVCAISRPSHSCKRLSSARWNTKPSCWPGCKIRFTASPQAHFAYIINLPSPEVNHIRVTRRWQIGRPAQAKAA